MEMTYKTALFLERLFDWLLQIFFTVFVYTVFTLLFFIVLAILVALGVLH